MSIREVTDSNKDLPLNSGGIESLYPTLEVSEIPKKGLYPSLKDLNKIDPVEYVIAPVIIKVKEPQVDKETASPSPYSQPVSASRGFSGFFSWFSSPKAPQPHIEWGKGGNPTQKDFIETGELYYGPRIIYIPKTTNKTQFTRLCQELEEVHGRYMDVFNRVATLFSQKVSAKPLSERVAEYNAVIKEAAAPFKTLNKRRQVERDLRGFFLNHLIEDEGQKVTTKREVDALIQETLLPFAETGDPQHPFAPVLRPHTGIQYVTLGREEQRPTLFQIPDLEKEKAKVEKMIRSQIFVEEPSKIPTTSPVTLAFQMRELAQKAFQREESIELNAWKDELKSLHEGYRSQVSDGASPLADALSTLDVYLICTHRKLLLDQDKLTHDPSKENLRVFEGNMRVFKDVRNLFNALREVMGEEAPRPLLMTQQALDYTPHLDNFYLI